MCLLHSHATLYHTLVGDGGGGGAVIDLERLKFKINESVVLSRSHPLTDRVAEGERALFIRVFTITVWPCLLGVHMHSCASGRAHV